MAQPTNPRAFRAARQQAGLTVTQVKDATNINRSTIYRLEARAARWTSAHVVDLLGKTYGVPTTFFFQEPK